MVINKTILIEVWLGRVECLRFKEKGPSLKILPVLYCCVKLVFFLTAYVFGSCFRALAVILVSDYFSGYVIFYFSEQSDGPNFCLKYLANSLNNVKGRQNEGGGGERGAVKVIQISLIITGHHSI